MKSLPEINVEVTRGGFVESRHRVTAIVVDADAKTLRSYGDGGVHVFPRSAVKALQALPMVESGAVEAYGLDQRHIALACASHNGEPMHVCGAGEMLAAAGLGHECLECGAQAPARDADRDQLARNGEKPAAIHNNCSGKHAGFLCFAAHQAIAPQGYSGLDHPVQREIASALEAVTGARHGQDNHAMDGCSIPTYAIPLERLATGFARFSVAQDASPGRSAAMQQIMSACFAHPEMVAGTDRFDTTLMRALKGRAFTKTGAEGVFIAALPELGVGIALKAADGAGRAAEAAIAQLIESLLELDETEGKALKRLAQPVLKNWNGHEVGRVRAVLPS